MQYIKLNVFNLVSVVPQGWTSLSVVLVVGNSPYVCCFRTHCLMWSSCVCVSMSNSTDLKLVYCPAVFYTTIVLLYNISTVGLCLLLCFNRCSFTPGSF